MAPPPPPPPPKGTVFINSISKQGDTILKVDLTGEHKSKVLDNGTQVDTVTGNGARIEVDHKPPHKDQEHKLPKGSVVITYPNGNITIKISNKKWKKK